MNIGKREYIPHNYIKKHSACLQHQYTIYNIQYTKNSIQFNGKQYYQKQVENNNTETLLPNYIFPLTFQS